MSGSGTEPATTGVAAGTWATSFADYVLTQLIKFGILDQMMADHHLATPVAEFGQARTEAEQGVAQDSRCPAVSNRARFRARARPRRSSPISGRGSGRGSSTTS